MPLIQRVAALIRANLNDLIDRAEDPQKMLKQVILDMENQIIQVKTQVAIAVADEQLLRKKQQESAEKHAEWMRKADQAIGKKQDDVARAAIERALGYKNLADNFNEEISQQKTQLDQLKSVLQRLEDKLSEAKGKSALLIAKHRRSRALTKASEAHMAVNDAAAAGAFERVKNKVMTEEILGQAMSLIANNNVEEKLAALDKDGEIEKLLADLKARKDA